MVELRSGCALLVAAERVDGRCLYARDYIGCTRLYTGPHGLAGSVWGRSTSRALWHYGSSASVGTCRPHRGRSAWIQPQRHVRSIRVGPCGAVWGRGVRWYAASS